MGFNSVITHRKKTRTESVVYWHSWKRVILPDRRLSMKKCFGRNGFTAVWAIAHQRTHPKYEITYNYIATGYANQLTKRADEILFARLVL